MSGRFGAPSSYSDDPSSDAPANNVGSSYTSRFRTDDADTRIPVRPYSASDFGSGPGYGPSPGASFGSSGDPYIPGNRQHPNAKLLKLIDRAVGPAYIEPNLSINLEIADFINSKKGTAPHDAAMAIVKRINSSNSHVGILAIALLDICVKNCGYAFHLQISRKEFLNELVRKFTNRPPPQYTRVQYLILECLEEWVQTICRTSRYKDDLGYIRDMHRLLSHKGYVFPEISVDDASVLNPSEDLKSAAELAKEEEEAQQAKLQELIRRGNKADLREANQLMKIMAGYQKSKTDFRAQAAQDIEKIRRKAELMNEMIQNITDTSELKSNDVLTEIYASLKNAQPKIKKMVSDEGDDVEAVQKLLGLNDYINALIDKYDLIKKGDLSAVGSVKVGVVAASPSLIDFDDEDYSTPTISANTVKSPNASALEDLLSGLDTLSIENNSYGPDGSVSLSLNSASSTPPPPPSNPSTTVTSSLRAPTIQNNLLDLDLLGISNSSLNPQSSVKSDSIPSVSGTPDFSALSGLSGFGGISGLNSPSIGQSQSQNLSSINSSFFGGLSPPTPTSSVTQTQSNSLLGGNWGAISTSSSPLSNVTATAPSVSTVILDSTLKIVFTVSRESPSIVKITGSFSNNSPLQVISNLNFQVAAPKSLGLNLEPLTSITIGPNVVNGAIQVIKIDGAYSGSPIRLRWRVSYEVGQTQINEDGIADNLPAV
ncbi:VHS-domain-containing protein [Nadsonia fulvescens var. elongata DSM 6958]|uniref:VHS-domain-containing protein n=1 Tax=Nadsonia fulvescens var. elongata DSM 6958 TaxID=857566 RepID=A0A1E3PPY6_9ASCO|nr:VHS-domain-containing protein [Nadsonia fulvescens var. elongata DSM 6958]